MPDLLDELALREMYQSAFRMADSPDAKAARTLLRREGVARALMGQARADQILQEELTRYQQATGRCGYCGEAVH